jgi:SWIM zinc finger
MSFAWTAEQILALAPDDSSERAGKGLAAARKWVSLGRDDRAAWGECQGSASTPYQTEIDLAEPAFKCTCPSRKFPCKHGLGLFLLLAGQPEAFTRGERPAWVTEWLEARDARAEKQAKKEASPERKPDEQAQGRRAAERAAKVTAGLQELELWLRDLMRHGLASVQGRSYSFWTAPAARMVDAQAPGVARMLQEMAGIPATGDGWHDRLAERLGRLYLLLEGFKRIETLPPAAQADIRSMIGWTIRQEDLRDDPGVRDRWQVVGHQVEEEERLRVQRTWLWGRETGRAALVLDFAHGRQPLDVGLVPGTSLDAELVFWPGSYPLRALVKERFGEAGPVDGLSGYVSIADAVAAYAEALSRNPWLEQFPVVLDQVTPARNGGGWIVQDAGGHALPIAPGFEQSWHLIALSGGYPMTLAGEWNGSWLLPLSVWAEGRFVAL